MAEAKVDALLLTTEPDVRYFSGFHTQFWESPTRPWFLLVPATGKPAAVIPGIGAQGMAQTWIDDIHTWTSPTPADDGVSLLGETIESLILRHGRLGVPMSHESHLRMPAADFARLREKLTHVELVDMRPALRAQQSIKSEAEIDKIRHICQLTSFAFEGLSTQLRIGCSERDACRTLKLDMLARGADSTPYVMGASGPGGYDNIIMGPTDRLLESGDVLIIDTGSTYDGYFCDFDRNFAFGSIDDDARRAHEVVFAATDAGLDAARPGSTTTDVWAAMWKVLEAGGALGNDVGRMGHGLGMQLTEWPSNMPGDDTVLRPGMVLTLEPGMAFAPNQLMVHEEDIVIRDGAPELLTRRAPAEMPMIDQ